MCQNNHLFIHTVHLKMLERFNYVSDLLTGMICPLVAQETIKHVYKRSYLKKLNAFKFGGTVGQL